MRRRHREASVFGQVLGAFLLCTGIIALFAVMLVQLIR